MSGYRNVMWRTPSLIKMSKSNNYFQTSNHIISAFLFKAPMGIAVASHKVLFKRNCTRDYFKEIC